MEGWFGAVGIEAGHGCEHILSGQAMLLVPGFPVRPFRAGHDFAQLGQIAARRPALQCTEGVAPLDSCQIPEGNVWDVRFVLPVTHFLRF